MVKSGMKRKAWTNKFKFLTDIYASRMNERRIIVFLISRVLVLTEPNSNYMNGILMYCILILELKL